MAQLFFNVKSFAYQGTPNVAPIKIRNISGQSVPLLIPWGSYSISTSNIGINVSLDGQGVQASLQQIRSVYIDNMQSSCPVYIVFPDTGYVVVAKENSAGWFPVYTNQYKIAIIALGIDPNAVPTTKVLITNVPIEASIDVEIDSAISQFLASPVIQRAGIFNPSIGIPALGDQFQSVNLASQTNGATVGIFGTPLLAGEFIYVTSCFCTINMFVPNTSVQVTIESTGASGILFQQTITVPAGEVLLNSPFLEMTGQWKLDASQFYRVRNQIQVGMPIGQINFNFSYTINP
jgi:hypothetical protein